jgi:hypothetical protein
LTKTLGFSYVPTLLMSAPPWVFSCMFSVLVAWSSDRRQEKVRHTISTHAPKLILILASVLAHRRTHLHGPHWLHHQHFHNQGCRTLRRALPPGRLLRWVRQLNLTYSLSLNPSLTTATASSSSTPGSAPLSRVLQPSEQLLLR